MRVLPLCDDCGRRIKARRRWPFGETLCRRCYVKAWFSAILAAVSLGI
jgi:NMD protein affecting ribosome stability and mRNA decay